MPHIHRYVTTRQTHNDCCGAETEAPQCIAQYARDRVIEPICYSEWLPNVRILAPHVPDNILLDYIRRGAIEFAKQAAILQRNIVIPLQECVADYYPCLGDDERIQAVRMLSYRGDCYKAMGNTCSWDVGDYRFWFHPPNTLEIHPAPRKICHDVILTVDAVPSENSTQCDRIIYDRHFQAVEAYAAAQASLIPPDVDTPKAYAPRPDFYPLRMEIFRQAVQRAKIDLVRKYATHGEYWLQGDCR